MKEAAEKVIDYAFNTIKVKKIEAFFHRDNQSSIKLLEKFSFRNSNEPDKTNPDLICYHLTNFRPPGVLPHSQYNIIE
jgi:ribosomal-protein-alanine N-acetyltransferase